MKLFGLFATALVLSFGSALWAADTAPATKPAAPACCGDACKNMGTCCTVDSAGKATCSMGGSCCVKAK
jgi:hypothetical protein